ncbi:hypothetical protein [Methylobacterium gnaphalii]|uniref:Uncharacterized protein n=1 Tax=Methylobacterium gnaphalii TaxID=1010610 RepID=A0A512JQN9_9HYPH|nr:hypothetical protein [Methylobacterium gnaphalii]GEP12280.1 hypothetical protein MGN01_41250 [Methylobacterium gnaphalii]GJD68716.1 hypothetical protein MMMDOFMJ_1640 [Methylobacterium gnaphalii]GLS49387.1 hypothetical protein GCM10007885_22350 [Methylobacterium gnaphalii]
MAVISYYAVQPFIKTKTGRVSAGQIQQCQSADQAKVYAERIVRDKKAIGALAYTRIGNDFDNLFDDPVFIARVGDVPEHDNY